MVEVEFYIVMNENGDWEVAPDAGDAATNLAGGVMIRAVRMVVKMSPPEAGEVTVTVPDDVGETTEAKAE